jgi:hypothetical protein
MRYSTTLINSLNDNQKKLKRSIESCLCQDGVKIQIILSTVKDDPSIKTARKISKDIDIVINDKPSIYGQINNALPLVKHDWFSFFSGNDVALKNKIKDEIDMCVEEKKICYSAYYMLDKQFNIKKGFNKKKLRTINLSDYDYKEHLSNNFITDVSLIHKSILEKYSPFNEKFDKFAFYDFWLRVAEGEGPSVFAYNNKPSWTYVIDKNSLCQSRFRDKKRKKKYRLYRKFMLSYHDGSEPVETFGEFKKLYGNV